jgi:hypothetical protein
LKTFSNLKADFLTLSKNESSDNSALAATLLNLWIRKILSLRDWSFNTGVDTITTGTSQSTYELPYNCFRVKTVKQKNDDTSYILTEVKDRDTWNILNESSDTSSDIATHWFVNEADQLEIFPKSDDGGNTLYVYFRKVAKDFLEADYESGTVTITKGSTYLVGTGTNWTETMVGRHFSLGYDGFWYEIGGYITNTYLYLKKPYRGKSVVGDATYEIGDLIPIPEGFEDIVLWAALADYFLHRGENVTLAEHYDVKYKEALQALVQRDRRTEKAVLTSEADIVDRMYYFDPNNPPEISE